MTALDVRAGVAGRLPAWSGSGEVLVSPWVPASIAVAAVPMLRPNVFGEMLSPLGLLLLGLAAVAALLRRPSGTDRLRFGGRTGIDPATALVTCVGLGYLHVVVYQALTPSQAEARVTLQGLVLTVGSLAALLVICRDPHVRVRFARAFLVLMSVLCASYVLTALTWAVAGVGSGQVGMVPIGAWGPQPVYFPFTTTVGIQPVLGIEFPRFTGLGREPGWMAMYCAAAFFLAPMAGWRGRIVKPLMLAGLLGAVSTAGFGVFVVVWAYHHFLRDRGGITLRNYARQVVGVGAAALAIWLAVDAPILGLSAKSTQNATSLDDRQAATDAGLRALTTHPWGGRAPEAQSGINLISDIALSGLPFVLLVLIAFAMAAGRSGPTRFSNAVVLVVFTTMLLSQPAKDSTWAFGLVLLAATLRRPDTPEAAGVPRPTTQPRRRAGLPRDHP